MSTPEDRADIDRYVEMARIAQTRVKVLEEALEEAHGECLDCEKALPCKARAALKEGAHAAQV